MLSTPTGSGISALIEQGTDLLFAGHDLAAPTVPPGTTEVLARLIPPFVIPISDSLHEQAGAFPQSVSSYNGALYLTGPGFYISGVAAGPAVRSASGTEGWTSFDLQGQVNTNATATYQNELVLSGQTILTPGGGAPVVWARWFTPTPCYANCDASTSIPLLNVNDFICFLNRFAAGDPYANCDQSTTAPMLNVLDFTCFLNQFAAGCS